MIRKISHSNSWRGYAATVTLLLLMPCWYLTTLAVTASPNASAEHQLFDDQLRNGWEDWSWDSTTAADATTPVHNGTHAYAVTYEAAWAGFYLKADPAFSTAGYTHLRFWIHGGATGGQQLQVKFNESDVRSMM
ncbi:MAG: hypothetical protein R2932_53090 [Caldilineaceae bacterium]